MFVIFDIFVDEEVCNVYFFGVVVVVLYQNVNVLVVGGWDDGVVVNINNFDVLLVKELVEFFLVIMVIYIMFEVVFGKGLELVVLLIVVGLIVVEIEFGILFWVVLQIDEIFFVIFDIFVNNVGCEVYFVGQVVGLLNEWVVELVVGGWDDGVIVNVYNFDIFVIKQCDVIGIRGVQCNVLGVLLYEFGFIVKWLFE